ncbi:putative RNA-directed DNA polymerase, eukaryota, reverse transcriptase zinc-binding domain protein [Tanacetum coccineum]
MQKANIEWLKLGDANTTYFHKVVKSQASRNQIDCITDPNGAYVEGDQVPMAFINYYFEFLGQSSDTTYFQPNDLFCNRLSADEANAMVREVSNKEIRDAMFSLGDNKAPVLLKELNHTICALIPKVATPMRITDYRPISCCNVLFKCVSKIISKWLKESLSMLISMNQSTFVPGRRIFDNILLTQELMHNYHFDRGPPRCAFKVDIQKAYDTIDWIFWKRFLLVSGFTLGRRGLRQGDPMSPYLFTLVMKVLTLIVIMDSLNEFKNALGLVPSLPKSSAYFCNVLNYIKVGILNIIPFEEGTLPVKYIGVPLVLSRLVYRDCSELMEKIKKRISDWENKFLSFAELERIMRGFLWCEMRKGKAKVAWEAVCLPKIEGGLGIRRLEEFNKALITLHIWSILTNKETLWIHSYKISVRSFWDIPYRGNLSWGWIKILQILHLVRPYFWSRIGNGNATSAWFDNWSTFCRLLKDISNRDIYSTSYKRDSTVSKIINQGSWTWPNEWFLKYPLLWTVVVPNLSNSDDRLSWRNLDNSDVGFSVAAVRDCIRPRSNEVEWFHVVWFSYQIPRHANYLWLVLKRKLKTQDLMRP